MKFSRPLFMRYRVLPYFLFAIILGKAISMIFLAQAHMPGIASIMETATKVAALMGSNSSNTENPRKVTLRLGPDGTSTVSLENADDSESSSTPRVSSAISKKEGRFETIHRSPVKDIQNLKLRMKHNRAGETKRFPLPDRVEFLFFLMAFAALFFYNLPIRRILAGNPDLRTPDNLEKAIQRALNLTFFTMRLCWYLAAVSFFCGLWYEWAINYELLLRRAMTVLAASIGFGFISSTMILSWFDSHLLKFISELLTPETLYTLKSYGKSISLDSKILRMVVCTSIMPMALLSYVNLLTDPGINLLFHSLVHNDWEQTAAYVVPSLISLAFSGVIVIFSLVMAITLSGNMRKSLARPLETLISRMEGVRDGDYNTLTTVFLNDEMGRLKAHFNEMVLGLRQREFIRDTFGRYVSEEITREILEGGKIELGGEKVTATVLFSDIRNFTAMSENMEADEVVAFLNELFSHIVKPIHSNGGVVNKYIGDCVMALFGVPAGKCDHGERAIRAALGMRAALEDFNAVRLARGDSEVKIGIGIHTGQLVAGNIGALDRMEYTVIGDTVNVASRIESMTKELGVQILYSSNTQETLSAQFAEEIGGKSLKEVLVKGRQASLQLFTL
ncbi:MAG: hypothetical protein CVV64_14310 [Candidatus Wallbacteria bacterium HGW-Wallbacteria-1]|uniref:Adenylate/guanylate cyclase domain-containing protein n=1 Tax=Candidatus Wallbacteria bacterium HGW-Wallbacteria-1 TaxID=2013854 RepID=A0A2N1PM88_9BACT|nr:MAG: hypothetical protein CVV64_14310 [Candidatus Wallbacteria bacterium HGW-Wallbacteria-1]